MALIIRLLILAALAWFGYRLIRTWMAKKTELPPHERPPEVMQRCAHCQVHVPAGESTQSRGLVFCSEDHRDAYFRDHPPSA